LGFIDKLRVKGNSLWVLRKLTLEDDMEAWTFIFSVPSSLDYLFILVCDVKSKPMPQLFLIKSISWMKKIISVCMATILGLGEGFSFTF